MAKLTKFLGSVVGGIFGGDGDMRDYQHAQRLFADNLSALSPKVEFLFHVYFDINKSAVRSPNPAWGFGKQEPNIEVGMLVKQAQVPGVIVNTETKNQYGKKTNIQTSVQYSPVTITFHDDNTNLTSGMWQQYFQAYYADSQYIDELQRQPTYNAVGNDGMNQAISQSQYKFGFDVFKSKRFFNEIKIYQLSRHFFYEYTLINPIITQWQAPNLNYASSQPAENQMTIAYEGIRYAQGNVAVGTPDGFAQLHYDSTPSPLSLMGGGTASLFGSTGVLAGGLDVFGDLASGKAFSDPFALLGTAIKAKNTYENAKQLSKQGIKGEVESIVTGAITNTVNNTIRVAGSGKLDFTQATQADQGDGTVANKKDLDANARQITDQRRSSDGATVTEYSDGSIDINYDDGTISVDTSESTVDGVPANFDTPLDQGG